MKETSLEVFFFICFRHVFLFSHMNFKLSSSLWSYLVPVLAWLFYFFKPVDPGAIYITIMSISLMGVVMAAVHHAEVIAHKVGEPFGTLVLAVAITIIEVSLIVSLMVAGGDSTSAMARDTVFSAVMIILTGLIGMCLIAGSVRYKEQTYTVSGVNASLVALMSISVLAFVLPNYTTSVNGPFYSSSQLIFVALVTLIIYGVFVYIQTGRHRDYFLPDNGTDNEEVHAESPSNLVTIVSVVMLMVSLGAVVLLAKTLSPSIEKAVVHMGAPKTLVGVIVALVILLPEGTAAIKAARKNRLQTSLNLALGSAMASIGLTIPCVALVSLFTGMKVSLGIDTKSMVLLMLTLLVVILSLGKTGRTNLLQGVVLLVIFMVYIFTAIIP